MAHGHVWPHARVTREAWLGGGVVVVDDVPPMMIVGWPPASTAAPPIVPPDEPGSGGAGPGGTGVGGESPRGTAPASGSDDASVDPYFGGSLEEPALAGPLWLVCPPLGTTEPPHPAASTIPSAPNQCTLSLIAGPLWPKLR